MLMAKGAPSFWGTEAEGSPVGQVVSSYCNFLTNKKHKLHSRHAVWKAPPDRLLRAGTAEASGGCRGLCGGGYTTRLLHPLGWGGWRAAEPSVDSWTRAWTPAPGAAWPAPPGSRSVSAPPSQSGLCIEKL
uniref:Uncharacterized protein n=1 Tax=Pipistrellus kuhlii TaxID=59472 RepID=A0A7J7VUQ0_PIPKU|nr:hypothetical protein mPipKuh1_008269 [Pipistrellus kuhlii]